MEAPGELSQPDYYHEMHNRLDLTIVLPPAGFPGTSKEKRQAGGSMGCTYNPFEVPVHVDAPSMGEIPALVGVVDVVPPLIAVDEEPTEGSLDQV